MNRVDLVKKLSSIAEVPFSEGEIFLEMFVRRISGEIESDEVVNLPELGSFTSHKSKSDSSRIIFTSDLDLTDLTFYLGEEKTLAYEKYSLSIGKPVLPIHEKSNLNFIINPNEYIHSLESKADKLVTLLQKSYNADEDLLPGNNEIISPFDLDRVKNELPEDNVFEEIVDSTYEEINEVSFSDNEEIPPVSLEENLPYAETEESEEISDFVENRFIPDNTIENYDIEEAAAEITDESAETIYEDEQTGPDRAPGLIEEEKNINNEAEVKEAIYESAGNVHDEEIKLLDEDKIQPEEIIAEITTGEVDINISESEPGISVIEDSDENEQLLSDLESLTAEEDIIAPRRIYSGDYYVPQSSKDKTEEIHDNFFNILNNGEFLTQETEVDFPYAPMETQEVLPEDDSPPVDYDSNQLQTSEIKETKESLGDLAGEILEKEKSQPGETKEVSSLETISGGEISFDGKNLKPTETDLDVSSQFQRVKSLTREFFNLSEFEKDNHLAGWDSLENEQLEKDIKKVTRAFDDPEPAAGNEGFTSVKSRKTTYEWAPEELPELDNIILSEEGETEETAESDDDIFSSGRPITKTVKIVKKEQNSSKYFIIAFIVLTIIAMAVIAYYKFFNDSSSKDKIIPQTRIIERKDLVPVMIPEKMEEIRSDIQIEKQAIPEETTTEISAELVKIKDGIYRRGNIYFAQVSSWQTRSKADREAVRLSERGYKTEIKSTLLKSGWWYSILVGEFNSEAEAENFLKNNY